eukprot:524879-Pelagomonas_calceolata.AAC.5
MGEVSSLREPTGWLPASLLLMRGRTRPSKSAWHGEQDYNQQRDFGPVRRAGMLVCQLRSLSPPVEMWLHCSLHGWRTLSFQRRCCACWPAPACFVCCHWDIR